MAMESSNLTSQKNSLLEISGNTNDKAFSFKKVNKQDSSKVFQGIGLEKMEDNFHTKTLPSTVYLFWITLHLNTSRKEIQDFLQDNIH